MRPWSWSLREVHAHGNPGLHLRTSQEEGRRENSQDGRGMCMLPVSENPHGNTVNDALTLDYFPPRDTHQSKKEGEWAILSPFLDRRTSLTFGSNSEMRR
jgi:hypothetical protein